MRLQVLLFLLLAASIVRAEINVTLLKPANNHIEVNSSVVNFVCNASSNNYIRSITLYHNASGRFEENESVWIGELGPKNKVLLFHFNNESVYGESNSLVYDFSGNGNNGTAHGATFNSSFGKYYGSFYFDGVDDYIEVNDSNSLDLTDEGSIEMWFYISQDTGRYMDVLTKEGSCDMSPYQIEIDPIRRVTLALNSWYFAVSSSIQLDIKKWYHIVGVWNETYLAIYVNGTLSSEEFESLAVATNNENIKIGNGECGDVFNGYIDELAIYDYKLSADEIKEHYERKLSKYANLSVNLSLKDGMYSWNCLAIDNESNKKFADSNFTIAMDVYSAPELKELSIKPADNDSIDPGVRINITAKLYDVSGVDTAILQYRRSGLQEWNNISMLHNGLWYASFIPVLPPDTWQYRLFFNDTNGRANYSSIYYVYAYYDKTWQIEPGSLEPVQIFADTVGYIGSLLINNTGDYPLSFSMKSSMPDFYYNVSMPFTVEAKNVSLVNITAKAPIMPYEYKFSINITAGDADAQPLYRIVNGTLISFIGGPYFLIEIAEYKQGITQSSYMNLSANIKNIGNETANNVTITWILPAGWDVRKGNRTLFLNNLSSLASITANLTVYLDPSKARAGISEIKINVSCLENKSGYDSRLIAVYCNTNDGVCGSGCNFQNDADCPAPKARKEVVKEVAEVTKEIAVLKPVMEIRAPRRLDVFRGDDISFSITVFNPSDFTFHNITASMEGFPRSAVKITPELIGRVNRNTSKSFDICIAVPNYTAYGIYNLSLRLQGVAKSLYANFTIFNESEIMLVVHSRVENATLRLSHKLERIINTTFLRGGKLNEMLERAKELISEKLFDNAYEILRRLEKKANTAFEAKSMMETLNRLIAEARMYGISAGNSKKMLYLAQQAFQREDYERALKRANTAFLIYNIETRYLWLRRFVYENWFHIIIFSIILLYVVNRVRKTIFKKIFKRFLLSIKRRETILFNSFVELQHKYFVERSIGRDEYMKRIDAILKVVEGVRKKKLRFLFKTARYIKEREKRIMFMEKELEFVKEKVRKLQESYYTKGGVAKDVYRKMLEILFREVSELVKEIEAERLIK